MADTSDFRNGMTFIWKDDLWEIVDFLHVKPGKGGAFVRTTLKNVKDGHEVEETFRAGAKVDEVRVERRRSAFRFGLCPSIFRLAHGRYPAPAPAWIQPTVDRLSRKALPTSRGGAEPPALTFCYRFG